jgi:hypothetical protein
MAGAAPAKSADVESGIDPSGINALCRDTAQFRSAENLTHSSAAA